MLTRRRILAALPVLGCAPLLAGCLTGPSTSDTPELTLESRVRIPVAASVRGGLVADDVFVYAAGWTGQPTRLVAVGVDGGESRWQIDDRARLDVPGLGAAAVHLDGNKAYAAGGDILPVAFWNDPGRGPSGVVGLRVGTGRPVWGFTAAAQPKAPTKDGYPGAMVMAATDSIVLLVVGTPTATTRPSTRPTTMAVDVRTGALLWRRADVTGVTASGDAVVAMQSAAGGRAVDATPVVLDARTGRTRWTASGPGYLGSIGNGYVVFRLYGDDPYQRFEVAELSSGQRITLTEDELNQIRPASPQLIECDPPLLVSKGTRLVQELPDGRLEKAAPPAGFEISAGAGRYLWGIANTFFPHIKGSVVAVDRTGVQRSKEILRGGIVCVSDQWLAVARPGPVAPRDYTLELYRVTPV